MVAITSTLLTLSLNLEVYDSSMVAICCHNLDFVNPISLNLVFDSRLAAIASTLLTPLVQFTSL